jgi:hypothetical protein
MSDSEKSSVEKYEADMDTMFLAADGSMMCEKHAGQEWGQCDGGPDCAGPGTPWSIQGRTIIEEVKARAREDR